MYLRVTEKGKLLKGKTGRLRLRDKTCIEIPAALCVFTQDFEHYWCVECSIPERKWYQLFSDTSKVSYAVYVTPEPGEYDIYVRWVSSHDPYPEIRMMGFSVYGVYIPAAAIPKEPDPWYKVCHVVIREIEKDGSETELEILVDGKKGSLYGNRKYFEA